jgi:hypothetical protein
MTYLTGRETPVQDFDLLGYKYSLLSTVGTAGQNLVVTMIPARDPAEFSMFPQVQSVTAVYGRRLPWQPPSR